MGPPDPGGGRPLSAVGFLLTAKTKYSINDLYCFIDNRQTERQTYMRDVETKEEGAPTYCLAIFYT